MQTGKIIEVKIGSDIKRLYIWNRRIKRRGIKVKKG